LNKLSILSAKINFSFNKLALKVVLDNKFSILLFTIEQVDTSSEVDFKFIGNINIGVEIECFEFYKELVKDQEFLVILWKTGLVSKVLLNSQNY
jgi:hypothetical protein